MEKQDVVVAIDIGTTKIYAIIAKVSFIDKTFQVIGTGMSPSKGMKKGVIVDVAQVTGSVEAAIQSAEHRANVNIETAYIGVAGKHIESLMSHAALLTGKQPREITEADKNKLEELAENKVVPIDRKVIHKIVYNYKIDDSEIVKNPIGMNGVKLEADVHIVTGVVNSIDALVKSASNLSIGVEDVVLEPLASAKAVLNDTEKKFGAILVDIGGGTTDIAIFKNEKLIYTNVIPLGGEHYTNDIASVLNIGIKTAEKLKKEFSTYREEIDLDDIVEVPVYNSEENKQVELGYLKEIIDSRTEDILEQISKKIENSGFEHLVPNGIIFTGGASKVAGLMERAEDYFELPVRFGTPEKRDGLLAEMNKPEDATGVGLLLYGIEKYFAGEVNIINQKKSEESLIDLIKDKMKSWFEMIF